MLEHKGGAVDFSGPAIFDFYFLRGAGGRQVQKYAGRGTLADGARFITAID